MLPSPFAATTMEPSAAAAIPAKGPAMPGLSRNRPDGLAYCGLAGRVAGAVVVPVPDDGAPATGAPVTGALVTGAFRVELVVFTSRPVLPPS